MYLKGFANESDFVWVYDRKENKYLHQAVVNVAVKKDFYTVTGPDGPKSDAVEQMMANMVEGPMKPIIGRLDNENLNWEGEDRAILALFVALLRTRNLAFDKDQTNLSEQFQRWWAKATHPTTEAVEESFREYQEETGLDMSDVAPHEVFEMIRDDNYQLHTPRQNNIKMMMSCLSR